MSKISKIARFGLVLQGLVLIAILICVFLLKPVSDVWAILFVCGMLLAFVSEIFGAIKRKEK